MGSGVTVCVCQPIYDHVDPLSSRSWRDLDKLGGVHYLDMIGHPIEEARTVLTRNALALYEKNSGKRITHVLWIDSDMVYPPHALRRLLEHDKPIVGGLCYNRRLPYQPVVAREFDPRMGFAPGTVGWVYDLPEDGLTACDRTGAAFLLVKREVFEAIAEKFGDGDPQWAGWWSPAEPYETHEDMAFCWRARQCGFPVFVDCGLEIGHRGMVTVDRKFADRNRLWQHQQFSNPFERRPADGAPVASIVIPAFNPDPVYLRAAVRSALAQTVPVEVIIVDDGSDVAVQHLFDKFNDGGPLRIIGHLAVGKDGQPIADNRGIAAALNTGIQAMQTNWFCWLSADDLFEPNKVERQLRELTDSESVCGFHTYNLLTHKGKRAGQPRMPRWSSIEEQRAMLASCCCINGSTVMISKDALDRVRLPNGEWFDTQFKYGQDWHMWCRLAQHFLWYIQMETLGSRREGENLTYRLEKNGGAEWLRKQAEDRMIMETFK